MPILENKLVDELVKATLAVFESVFALDKNTIPNAVINIATRTEKDNFSLKNIAIIIATIAGYTNKIVHAIPDSMYLNETNNVIDDNEKVKPKINKVIASFLFIFKDIFLTNLSQK